MGTHFNGDGARHDVETDRTVTGDRGGWLRGLRRGRRAPESVSPTQPEPLTGAVPAPRSAGPRPPHRTRAGSTWVIACVAVLILIALIIFIAQNAGAVQVSFVSLHGRFSLAVALLAAVAAGCLLTLVLGTTRILQLRRLVRRRHRDDLAAAVASPTPDTLSGAPQPQHPVRDGADTAGTG